MIAQVLLLLLLPFAAGAGTIPGSALGLEFDTPVQDRYLSGQALPLKGAVRDASLADGQVLFNFVPRDSGEAVQVFLNLEGTHFAGYQIFRHDQSGTYDLEVYLGGPGDTRLGFSGVYEGLQIDLGGGEIRLPADFFPGVQLDGPFSTGFASGEAVVLAGKVIDPLRADGQLLWVFAPLDGGDEKRVYLPLRGDRFYAEQVFRHEQSGFYQLSLYLGGAGETSLAYVGGFEVEVRRGTGEIQIPRSYFAGLRLDQPLPTRLPLGQAVPVSGVVEPGVRGLRIELISASTRQVPI
ncbi:MAG: hypothetical protein IT369_23175, partial [Candidatus Latescibacteria bacterium]|nr:hypothetical protein [Candidatus Latescibacterota bacterium]